MRLSALLGQSLRAWALFLALAVKPSAFRDVILASLRRPIEDDKVATVEKREGSGLFYHISRRLVHGFFAEVEMAPSTIRNTLIG